MILQISVVMDEPDLFAKINSSNTAETKKVLDKYANAIRWSGKDVVLDIGCGPGDVTINHVRKRLPETFEKLIGVDISDNMIEYCREKYKDLRATEFHKMDIGGDMNKYPDFLEKFDHIVSFTVLHWVQDQKYVVNYLQRYFVASHNNVAFLFNDFLPYFTLIQNRKVFSNILKLLKPGGNLLATFVASITSFYMYEQINEKWNLNMHDYEKFIGPYHHSDDPAAEVRKILNTVGFSEFKVEIKYQQQVINNEEDLKSKKYISNTIMENKTHDHIFILNNINKNFTDCFKHVS